LEIRILEPHHADQCLALRLEALKTNPEAFSSSYEEEITNPTNKYIERLQSNTSFTFGAFENESLIGMVGLVRETYAKLKHKASIVGMFVRPEKRGSGVGRALLEAALQKARTLDGIEQVNLGVVSTNDSAKRLYSSIGFEVFGTENKALKIAETYYNEDFMVLFL
jgi:ribosomal protein S18 acetylase RimI-like enzyme